MKLVFNSEFKSIKGLKEVELPDFTVLTGANGSGKTHLLHAIVNRNIQVLIEGKTVDDCIYFNHSDFIVKNDPVRIGRRKEIRPNFKISQNLDNIQNEINNTRKKIEALSEHNYFSDEVFKQIQSLFIDEELNLVDKLPNYSEVSKYVREKLNSDEYNECLIKEIYDFLCRRIKELFEDKVAKRYIIFSKMNNISFSNLRANDLKLKEGYLGIRILNEFRHYAKIKKYFLINLTAKKAEGKKLDEEVELASFEKKNGRPPWNLFNEILDAYDFNDYRFDEDIFSNIAIKVNSGENIKLKLKNTKGDLVDIMDLSSGEKTLFALALTVYQQERDRKFPQILLLDEIDASLHPAVVQKMLGVLKDVFLSGSNLKIILVTHSPSTIALAPDGCVFALENNGNQAEIQVVSRKRALNILSEGFVSIDESESDLGIAYNISRKKVPVLFTEGITDKIILEMAWKKLNDTEDMPFYIQDCFDAKFLTNLFLRGDDSRYGIFRKYKNQKFIALFDFDSEGYAAWEKLKERNFPTLLQNSLYKTMTLEHRFSKAYALLLPIPKNFQILNGAENSLELFSNRYKFSIELMLFDEPCLSPFYKSSSNVIYLNSKKTRFVGKIQELNQNISFKNFKPLFDHIKMLLNPHVENKKEI